MHYRAQLNASGHPALPVLITETGWEGHNESAKATSMVAAYEEEWLPDRRVEAVIPFLLRCASVTRCHSQSLGCTAARVRSAFPVSCQPLTGGRGSVVPQFPAQRGQRERVRRARAAVGAVGGLF